MSQKLWNAQHSGWAPYEGGRNGPDLLARQALQEGEPPKDTIGAHCR